MKTALITGVAGQDGHYLSERLISRGYRVAGLVRPGGRRPLVRTGDEEQWTILEVDLTDSRAIEDVVSDVRPAEVYNLAAESFGPTSWEDPLAIGDLMGLSVARFLDVILRVDRSIRFFQASSSEIFGVPSEVPQNEATRLEPRTPYGVAKAFAQWMVRCYRDRHQLFCCSGILFNHESPLRRKEFVTRRISHGAARIRLGLDHELRLGNLDARRDWGYAPDFADAMWRMLQSESPRDFVVATGESHSVRDFCRAAFEHVGLDWNDYVVTDPARIRTDDPEIVGDPTAIGAELGWKPTLTFEEMVRIMVDADLEALSEDAGHQSPAPGT